MIRRATIVVVWLAIAIAGSTVVSCTRVVDLDFPDAASSFPDAAMLDDGGSDGGIAFPDGGPLDDGAIGDASPPDAL